MSSRANVPTVYADKEGFVKCPYCQRIHRHGGNGNGIAYGHRQPDCGNKVGYYVVTNSEPKPMTASNQDVAYIKSVLPNHYRLTIRPKGVQCVSDKGIDDEETWDYIYLAIRQKFGSRFQEIDHDTCTNHLNFVIYLRSNEHSTTK